VSFTDKEEALLLSQELDLLIYEFYLERIKYEKE
jgi:hypothetical protein